MTENFEEFDDLSDEKSKSQIKREMDALQDLGALVGASTAQMQVARFAADLRAAATARDEAEGVQASSLAAVSAV